MTLGKELPRAGMFLNMIAVQTLSAPAGADEDFDQLAALFVATYPEQGREERELAEELRREWREFAAPERHCARRFMVREGGRIVANASLIPRRMKTTRGEMIVAALGAVMTHPDLRGRGFGYAVVRAAFDCVDGGEFPFSVFQTGGARDFYERMGCRVVTNRFVNSLDREHPDAHPFWEKWMMCYDPRGEMPSGQIDILGPGY